MGDEKASSAEGRELAHLHITAALETKDTRQFILAIESGVMRRANVVDLQCGIFDAVDMALGGNRVRSKPMLLKLERFTPSVMVEACCTNVHLYAPGYTPGCPPTNSKLVEDLNAWAEAVDTLSSAHFLIEEAFSGRFSNARESLTLSVAHSLSTLAVATSCTISTDTTDNRGKRLVWKHSRR